MKIINEKGRLFGLINIVDLLVLLALAASAVFFAWRLTSPEQPAAATETLSFTVRVRGVNGRMEPMIRETVEKNGQLFTSDGVIAGAFATQVSFEPYIQQSATADGRMVDTADPARVDVIFTLEAPVPKNAAPLTVGTQEIRVGVSHIIRTRLFEYVGNVETLTLKAREEAGA